jgi:hypothetical protein
LRDTQPTSASVSIIRPRIKPSWAWYDYHDPSFHFEGMTRTEKKRAVLSISEKSLKMQAPEIEIARHLTDILFDWLSQRRGLPIIDRAIPSARIWLACEGGPELVSVVEKLGDPEVLSSAQVGPVYTQGEPRRPAVRWLPDLSGIDKTAAVSELAYFEKSLADGQGAEVRNLVDRIGAVFKKRVAARRAKVNQRGTEILGYGAQLTYRDKLLTDQMLDGHEYEDILASLEEAAKEKKPREKIRTWRG